MVCGTKCSVIPIFPIHIYIYIYIYRLQEESTRLGLRMTIFFSGGTRTFLVNKTIQEKLIKFPNIFELYKS